MCFKYVALELQVSRKFKNMKIDIHIYNYNNIDRPISSQGVYESCINKAFKIYK